MKRRKVPRKGNFIARWWSLLTPAAKKKIITLVVGSFFAVIFVVVGSFLVFKGLGKSDFFQISSLKIEGNRTVKKEEIVKISGLDIYSNLLSIDTEKIRKNIEAHEWIERVLIKKKWPHILRVIVRERKPIAIVNTAKGFYYADKHGNVFTQLVSFDDLDYPVITGMDTIVQSSEDEIAKTSHQDKLKDAIQLIRYATNGSSSFPRQNISQISLEKDGKLVLFLADRSFPIYLGEEVTKQKYRRLKKVLYFLYKKKEFADVDYIRLDYLENKVLVGKNNS